MGLHNSEHFLDHLKHTVPKCCRRELNDVSIRAFDANRFTSFPLLSCFAHWGLGWKLLIQKPIHPCPTCTTGSGALQISPSHCDTVVVELLGNVGIVASVSEPFLMSPIHGVAGVHPTQHSCVGNLKHGVGKQLLGVHNIARLGVSDVAILECREQLCLETVTIGWEATKSSSTHSFCVNSTS